VIAAMTPSEREQYVRWWKERSGLKPQELRRIATGIWSDHIPLASPSSRRGSAAGARDVTTVST